MSELVGSATIRIMGRGKESDTRVISGQELRDRAVASCSVGTAACSGCFQAIETAPSEAEGVIEVSMVVRGGSNCGATAEQLQVSMGRLEKQRIPQA